MAFENYKNVENWETILFWDISASATSMSCKAWEWALFSTEFPFLLTLEKYSGGFVIKREIVKVTNRVDDLFTIVRAYKLCVQDDTAEPKTMTQNGLTFSSGDSITNAIYAENDADIKAELELKAKTSDVILKTGNQTLTGELTVEKIKWDGSELTGINAVVSSASLELMMSVNWTAWLAYSKEDYEQLDYSTDVDLWTTTQPQIAQSFYWQLAYTWNVIPLMVKTVWTPDDWVYMEIQTDNAGEPSGTVVANWTSDTIDYTNIAGAYEEENFTFSGWIVALTVWELYHFVLKRTGGNSDVNYYTLGSAWIDALFGNVSLYNGSAWSTDTNDLYFKFPWYKMAVLGWNNFIWILQADKNIWETWKFNTWYDNNQSGLTEWNFYSFNATTGIIESWTDYKAISETELNLLEKDIVNSIPDASEAVKGILKLSTSTLASVWTNDLTAMTPKKTFDAYGGVIEAWTSTDIASKLWNTLTSLTSYVKTGEMTIWRAGTYTVDFELYTSNGNSASYARLYKNWSPIWIERLNYGTSWVNYSQDFTFTKWDKLQMYQHTGISWWYGAYTKLWYLRCNFLSNFFWTTVDL